MSDEETKCLSRKERRQRSKYFTYLMQLEANGQLVSQRYNINDSLEHLQDVYNRALHEQLKRDREEEIERDKQWKKDMGMMLFTGIAQVLSVPGVANALGEGLGKFLAEKNKVGTKVEKEIVCPLCKEKNTIPLNNKPAFNCDNECVVCMDEKARIYQPQCGHIVLCEKCFQNM